ncbi:MAG: hypothetical protein Q9207_001492 [Kuettlingeria erythrocarpa]
MLDTDSAYSTPSPVDHLSDTISPIYPDRPIHPLPKRRLRSRVSPETAESILYTAASAPSKPLFSIPLNEAVAFGNVSSTDLASDGPAAGESQGLPLGQERHGYQFRGSDPDSDYEEADDLMRRYQAQRYGAFPPPNRHDLRKGSFKPLKVIPLISAHSPQESADGYDSFENTNNKKKRKIPTSGSSGGLQSSLSAEMASMGISANGGFEMSQTEMDAGVGQYYGSGNSAVPASSPGTESDSSAVSEQGIISTAIANAVSLSSTALRGQENVSLLEQQASKKPSSSKTQFTFTCESDSGKNMAWQERPIASAINPVYSNASIPTTATAQAAQQGRDFATQGTQTSPKPVSGLSQEIPSHGPTSRQTLPSPAKPRRSFAKQLAVAAKQRRLQREYDNYHHPPSPEDTWICEFCEYEMIFGSPPQALIRQYEIKDRQERRRLAEKRRLLEKAKMKGRKGKKGTKNASKSANGPNLAQQSASKQRCDQPVDNNPSQNQGTQSEDYLRDSHVDDPSSNAAQLPTPTRIPQPIAHAQHQSVRSTTNLAGTTGGTPAE